MRKIVGCATLAIVLCAGPVTSSPAQGATGASTSGGTAGTAPVGTPPPAFGTSPGSSTNTGSMSPSYSSAPMTNPGTLPSGTTSGGTQSSIPGTSIPGTSNSRLNGSGSGFGTNTPSAAAGRPCGLSLSDPTSGSRMPLTQPLSPGPAVGGCE